MINAAMARQMFNEDVPVGRHFQFVNGRDRAFPFGSSAWCRTRSIRASRLRGAFMPYTSAATADDRRGSSR